MFENFDPQALWEATVNWCGSYFWSADTLYQLAIIGAGFILGWFLYRLACAPLLKAIENSSMPGQVKVLSNRLCRLIWPAISLLLIFIAAQVTGSGLIEIEMDLLDVIMKLLMAWIVIRIAVQFIGNRFVRNSFALIIWAIAAMSIFGVLDETTATLDTIAFTIGEFRLSALAVVKSIFSLFMLLYLAIFVSSFAERRVFETKGLTRSSQVLIAKSVRITLIVCALLIGVTSAGIDLSLFAVFGGAVGLGIGFGLQKVVSNLFSGLLLLLDRSIEPGDVIELPEGTFGWVNQMGARFTEIVTRDNKSFLIPNEDFITQRVVNWSHGDTLIRLEVVFGVDYRHNPHEVRKIAQEAAAGADERVCTEPEKRAPVCHLYEFGDSSLNFKLRFWIRDAEKGVTNIRGAVMLALWDAFQEHDIKIPYPHRDIRITEQKKAS